MKRRLALLSIVALGGLGTGLAPVAASPQAAHPISLAAPTKPCSSGWVHAVLPWGHKCLRRGQFCKVSGDRYYHRYGYHCHTGRLR